MFSSPQTHNISAVFSVTVYAYPQEWFDVYICNRIILHIYQNLFKKPNYAN